MIVPFPTKTSCARQESSRVLIRRKAGDQNVRNELGKMTEQLMQWTFDAGTRRAVSEGDRFMLTMWRLLHEAPHGARVVMDLATDVLEKMKER